MKLFIIKYNSPEYHEMIALRNEILRKPLGLVFSENDLKNEASDIFCVCKKNDKIIGCCVLTKQDKNTVRLRQMAVASEYQGKGIGGLLLDFAEKSAKENGFGKITLHARLTAKDFYAKHGYTAIGNIFKEVGIDHIEMDKPI